MPKLMQRLGLRERLRETEVIDAWSKIVGDFIAAHSAPVALREGILYVRVLQPALHYELEQISKSEILRKLKQRFGGHQNHPRHPLPRRLKPAADAAVLLYNDPFSLLKPATGRPCEKQRRRHGS